MRGRLCPLLSRLPPLAPAPAAAVGNFSSLSRSLFTFTQAQQHKSLLSFSFETSVHNNYESKQRLTHFYCEFLSFLPFLKMIARMIVTVLSMGAAWTGKDHARGDNGLRVVIKEYRWFLKKGRRPGDYILICLLGSVASGSSRNRRMGYREGLQFSLLIDVFYRNITNCIYETVSGLSPLPRGLFNRPSQARRGILDIYP